MEINAVEDGLKAEGVEIVGQFHSGVPTWEFYAVRTRKANRN
jgi:hypothetical protein